MEHIAIDLGGRESQICVRDASGQILEERRYPTPRLGTYLKRRPHSRVILETSAEAFAVADRALAHGHEVRVVPATLVRSLGVGARRTKTDRRDAQVLSEVSCRIDLHSVHVPSDLARQRRSMCTAREALIKARTLLTNSVRGYMRTQVSKVAASTTSTFPQRVRVKLEQSEDGLPMFIEHQLAVLDELNRQIKLASDELDALAKEDPICQRLMTVPGVGTQTALRFVAAVDDVTRFRSAHALQSYLGLTPGENSSSERVRRTGITKAGPAMLRRNLVAACWALRRYRPEHPIVQWAAGIEERRGKFIAIVALSRKIAGILFAIWRDGSTYDPNHKSRGALK